MKNVVKKVFLFCLLIFAGFQLISAQEIQSAKFSISAKNKIWKKGEPAIVNASVKNISDSDIELQTIINFRVWDETGKAGNYYALFSLTKNYSKNTRECQSNLIAENVRKSGGAVKMYPGKNLVSLGAGEKKEFKVDLNGICWANSLSSFRGSGENLFETVAAGRYQIYFEMDFYGGMKEEKGLKYPTFVSLMSNKIEIEIK